MMVSAVSSCHSRGILHRDIKPENFLWTGENGTGNLKLADFGLAAIQGDGVRQPFCTRLKALLLLILLLLLLFVQLAMPRVRTTEEEALNRHHRCHHCVLSRFIVLMAADLLLSV